MNRGERTGQFKFLTLFIRLSKNKKKLNYNYCYIINKYWVLICSTFVGAEVDDDKVKATMEISILNAVCLYLPILR